MLANQSFKANTKLIRHTVFSSNFVQNFIQLRELDCFVKSSRIINNICFLNELHPPENKKKSIQQDVSNKVYLQKNDRKKKNKKS